MSQCKSIGVCLNDEEMLREHFPYVIRNADGDYIIPAGKVDAFVRKYMELNDNAEHMERLNIYRTSERDSHSESSKD